MANTSAKLILVTGLPGVGKTTLVKNVCSQLRDMSVPLQGFYTEEVKEGGRRIGFDVVTLCGRRGPLARCRGYMPLETSQLPYHVGRYTVQVGSFEKIALPALQHQDTCDSGECDHVTVVDEVGKMEMFSEQFSQTITTLTSPHSSCTVLATIPVIKGNAITLVEELRSSTKAILFEVTRCNRDNVQLAVVAAVVQSVTSHRQCPAPEGAMGNTVTLADCPAHPAMVSLHP